VLAAGTVLDNRYEIVGPLSAGGMGQIYRARRLQLGDDVAVKLMHTSFDAASDMSRRFVRESRACAQLRHPNIVTILDFNVGPGGQPYLVMELLSGPSLREELQLHGRMSPDAMVSILTPVAAALQLAHDRGITHRDLKPANIVAHRFDSGERVYKVIDFGLAAVRETSDQTQLTTPYMFLGTLGYAAPEQLRGEKADHRTDIYTLGVIVYEMLTGRRPFEAKDDITLLNDTLTATPVAPGERCPGLSSEGDKVVLRALAKDPAERWESVAAFGRALQEAVGTSRAPRSSASQDTILARYELGDMIGRGRLGSVIYKGTHRALGVPLAVRILRREEQPNWEAVRDRFLLEARTLQVPHPNLLHVRDYGEDERLVYLVTDYVDGVSLRQELARAGTLTWPRTRALLEQMLAAIVALNARGGFIVGVNPDMIRLSGTRIETKLVMSTAGIDSVQDVLATLREQELRGEEANEQELPYVAPEVLLGRTVATASDVFTVGVLAYEMLTGALPFRASSVPQLIGQMLSVAPASIRSMNADVPDAASNLIGQCLLPDVALRVPSANDVIARLREARL
jgi:serine/threonine protein kinase